MISVCLATHDGAKYVESQVRSILDQLEADDEIVVSDDGSSDNTVQILESLGDSRIRLFHFTHSGYRLPAVRRITKNFENALTHAKGDVIFLSDQDDVWLPDKVKTTMRYMRHYDYVSSDCYIVDDKLNILSETRYTKAARIARNRFLALVRPTPYQGSCAAFSRRVLDKALPIGEYIQSHDRWIGMVATFFFSCRFISDKLILYRRHEANSSTSSTGKSVNSLMEKVRWRLGYILGLVLVMLRGRGKA